MSNRNRSEGWQHAKLTGHSNEQIIENLLNTDAQIRAALSARLNLKSKIKTAVVGGLNETNVPDVLGTKTKSKTDLTLSLEDGSAVNISIKKSPNGQVYLIGVDRFLTGFEAQFGKKIPKDVERAIKLFFGGATDIMPIINRSDLTIGVPKKIKEYELRKKRVTWDTLKKYDPNLCKALIDWLKNNIQEISAFCFQRGLAKNQSEWAQYVWYRNELDEYVQDSLFDISKMKQCFSSSVATSQIFPGVRGGGTTIQLPFGFVQWHQSQIQFHHNQTTILSNCASL
jgi:hypothetical protein